MISIKWCKRKKCNLIPSLENSGHSQICFSSLYHCIEFSYLFLKLSLWDYYFLVKFFYIIRISLISSTSYEICQYFLCWMEAKHLFSTNYDKYCNVSLIIPYIFRSTYYKYSLKNQLNELKRGLTLRKLYKRGALF